MKTCASCQRHVHLDESRCPFCGTQLRAAEAPPPRTLSAMALVVGLALAGCGDSGSDEGETSGTPTESGESSSETATTDVTTDTTTDVTTDTTAGTTETTTDTNSSEADYGGPDWDTGTFDTGTDTSTGTDTGTGTGTDTGTDSGTADYGGAPPP